MLRRLPWRTFVAAFILTACALSLLCAFFVIECNIRQTTYGQVDLGVTYTVENGIPAVQVDGETLAVPPAVGQACEVVAPPPVRLFAALWRWETEAAAWFWEIGAATTNGN